MIAKVNIKMGEASYQFEFQDDDEIVCMHKAIAMGNPPRKCVLCGSAHLRLESSRAEGFTFVNALCNGCGARAKLGQYKDGQGYFWRGFEKKFEKQQFERYPNGQQPRRQVAVPEDELGSF